MRLSLPHLAAAAVLFMIGFAVVLIWGTFP